MGSNANELQGVKMEHKISHGSSTKVLDEKSGIVEAYVNTMEVVDSDGDIIAKDAFNNSFESLPIPVLASHDQTEVVGKVISAKNHENKLHATMQMNMETQAGREAFSNIAGKYVREWSVGFNMKQDGSKVETVDGSPVRVINDLDWVETSTVVRGASPETQTISAKSNEVISAPDTAPEAASGTEAETDDGPGFDEVTAALKAVTDKADSHADILLAELELLRLKLRLEDANKEA